MSGAVAAHAAYNGSGTQGLAVTNKISDDDGDVMSVFWNENDTTRQLLYGSSIIEIPASGSGGSLSAGGNQFFTVNNDIDALGDLYLQITTDTAPSGTNSKVGAFALLDCIKRIEFMVGTQVWQTLESADIGALNMTEMSEDAYESFFLAMSGGFNENQTRNSIGIDSNNVVETDVASKSVTGVLRIPALSRSVGPKFSKYADITENSYLLAGAPNQTVKIKVYMSSKTGPFSGFTLKLFGQCIVMCNDEREQIKTMPMGIPKRLKMTQNTTSSFKTASPGGGLQNVVCKMDLDHFSLYASHIILVINGDSLTNSSITDVELKLNSSSFSGVLQGALLTGPAADALGLFSNGIYIDTANYANNYYVFPLASQAYGSSSVPLNRFDNIRLEINLAAIGDDTAFSISATCVGETTALYKGGAASLAMY